MSAVPRSIRLAHLPRPLIDEATCSLIRKPERRGSQASQFHRVTDVQTLKPELTILDASVPNCLRDLGCYPSDVAHRHEGGNRGRPARGWVENRGDPRGDLIRCGLGHPRNELVLTGIDRPPFPSSPARYDGRAVSPGVRTASRVARLGLATAARVPRAGRGPPVGPPRPGRIGITKAHEDENSKSGRSIPLPRRPRSLAVFTRPSPPQCPGAAACAPPASRGSPRRVRPTNPPGRRSDNARP